MTDPIQCQVPSSGPGLSVLGESNSSLTRWGGGMLIAGVWLAMLLWSWMTWPDCTVDFGRELYVPWQLSEGRRLYTDIAYHNGPLSPYLNALWFAWFGVGLRTLVYANLVVATATLVLLYLLLSRIADRFAATLGCLTFATLFAFAQLTGIGNYNWICPYSHELTHGIFLSILCLMCLNGLGRPHGRWRGLLGGVCLGLVFLTKFEVFLAVAGASIVQTGSTCIAPGQRSWRRGLGNGAFVLAGALVPVVVAFGLLARIMPFEEALAGTAGAWRQVFKATNASSLFFRESMGLDQPVARVMTMLKATGAYGLLLGTAAGLALAGRRAGRRPGYMAPILFAAVAMGLILFRKSIPWVHLATPFPLIMVAAAAASGWMLWQDREDPMTAATNGLRLGFVTFAGALLLKMALNARLYQYGFALAMPAAMIVVTGLVRCIPAAIRRRGGMAPLFTAVALAAWTAAIVAHLIIMQSCLKAKPHVVGTGPDAFLADPRGTYLTAALDEIKNRTRPGQTLTVLPDGEMLAYLARLPNPTPYGQFNPHQVQTYGENQMLAAFRRTPPGLIAIVDADFAGYGYRLFGRDYARELNAWIQENYRQVALIGQPPCQGRGFGILLLERL